MSHGGVGVHLVLFVRLTIRLAQAWQLSRAFIAVIGAVLRNYGLTEQVLRWCWETRVCAAPLWRDHPAMPADLKAEVERTPDPPAPASRQT